MLYELHSVLALDHIDSILFFKIFRLGKWEPGNCGTTPPELSLLQGFYDRVSIYLSSPIPEYLVNTYDSHSASIACTACEDRGVMEHLNGSGVLEQHASDYEP